MSVRVPLILSYISTKQPASREVLPLACRLLALFYSIIFGLQIHLERLVAVAHELAVDDIKPGGLNRGAPALVLPLLTFIVQSAISSPVREIENISVVALHDDVRMERA